MVSVRLVNIKKRFGSFYALKGIDLEVREGELFFILGPSGCGKTTLLRIVAGLYDPDEGEVYFDDRLMNDVPPYERNVGMVFQNYALWPHMTVFDNVAYGLKARNLPRREIERRVKWALRLVRLEGMEGKYPNQLSGGQQQRVALARALVIEPDLLLLDEPLSNLDAKLRVRMRAELKILQKDLGITTIYVTHDQAEALSMADRIAVMNFGVVEQVGTPEEIYNRPSSRFVADFIGEINFVEGVVKERSDGRAVIETPIGDLLASDTGLEEGRRVVVGFRPERVRVARGGNVSLVVKDVMFYGLFRELLLEGNGVEVKVISGPEDPVPRRGERVEVEIEPEDLLLFEVR